MRDPSCVQDDIIIVLSLDLEKVVKSDIVPQLLTVVFVKGSGHLNRDNEVAVHHNLQATACSHVERLFLVGGAEGVFLDFYIRVLCKIFMEFVRIIGFLLLFEAVGLDHLSHIEEGVEGDVEVLVDEAEVDDTPAELRVEPCHTIAHYTVTVDTTY